MVSVDFDGPAAAIEDSERASNRYTTPQATTKRLIPFPREPPKRLFRFRVFRTGVCWRGGTARARQNIPSARLCVYTSIGFSEEFQCFPTLLCDHKQRN